MPIDRKEDPSQVNQGIELSKAIEAGNLDEVQALVSQESTNLNATDDKNHTPLIYALIHNKSKIAQCLLDNGADIHAQDNDRMTALRYAAFHGHYDLVKTLVEKGADINKKDIFGETPLIIAINKNPKIAQYLLDKGADIHAQDDYGMTALHYATFHGYDSLVKDLVEKGANVNLAGRPFKSEVQHLI